MRSFRRHRRFRVQPPQIVVLGFAVVTALGTLLLSLPYATRSGQRLAFIDALFTATSATCVTGLAVLDTGTTFSVFGQLVILSCIQIGGLGLMTFTTVFLVAMGRRLAITDRVAIQESFHHTPTGNLGTLILYIVAATFLIEGLGALILAAHWLHTGRFQTVGDTVYHAVFHSISAFCNAGFALYPDNLIGFDEDPVVAFVVSSLIVAGGIGFLAALDIKEYLQQTFFGRFWPKLVRERVAAIRPRPRLSLHTKFVLTVSAALLLIGTVSYYVLERGGLFAQMSAGEAWMNSYFCAVTARTAGFNMIDYAEMGGAGLLCTMVLMFIGASPGSTGGGIKTSTFGVLLAHGFSRWSGRRGLHAFKRTVSEDTLEKAESVVIAAVALVILAASALMASETAGLSPEQSQARFLSIVFETISAFGTVGLSVGLTPMLTTAGKIILVLVMFVGRTGPLTLALAITLRRKRPDYSYVEENLMVG